VTWLVMLAVGAGSFVFRVGPQLLFQRSSLSERADRVIRQAGIAAITALIVVSTKSTATGSATVPTLAALVAAIALAAHGASMIRLLFVGGGIYAASVIAVSLI